MPPASPPMITRLFNPPRAGSSASTPPGTRLYVVGDIHGRADLLGILHEAIGEDAADAPARRVIVYLGDYVDRGAESSAVVEMLASGPLETFEAVHLLGNHEAWLLDFLDDPDQGAGWIMNGGSATLMSYGIDAAGISFQGDRLAKARAELRRRLPPTHLAFLESLKLSHVEGDYLFVHAGIRPGVPLDRQSVDDLVWIRDEFLFSDADHGKVVVHGHTIVDEPEVLENRIGIDTGAFATGRLTCLVLEGTARRFIST